MAVNDIYMCVPMYTGGCQEGEKQFTATRQTETEMAVLVSFPAESRVRKGISGRVGNRGLRRYYER